MVEVKNKKFLILTKAKKLLFNVDEILEKIIAK